MRALLLQLQSRWKSQYTSGPPSPKEFIWIFPASLLIGTQQRAYKCSIFVLLRFGSGEKELLQNLIIGRKFGFILLNWCITYKRARSAGVHLLYIMILHDGYCSLFYDTESAFVHGETSPAASCLCLFCQWHKLVHMNGQRRLYWHRRVKDHADRLNFGGRTRTRRGPFISRLNNSSSR